ncbi:MAG: butyrate kinase [Defluviitaleaceae bacterium]|nr:butyrate kinase [Defluviitaleaceae bacterium]
MLILAINPGSTSTKIGVFDGSGIDVREVYVENIKHSSEELSGYPTLASQFELRRDIIMKTIEKAGVKVSDITGFVGRGGLLRPLESGCYKVNEALLRDAEVGVQGTHASNLGGILANAVANTQGKEAYIADPVVVDELCNEARISGHPLIPRRSIFHCLNQKAIAKRHCKQNNMDYNKSNLIVAHMGGGVSVGAHRHGRVIDVNNALDGEGPFSPERCGTLPARQLIDLCFSGEYTANEVRAMIQPKGGLVAYFGINDFKEACDMAETNAEVKLVLDAMCYSIAKFIGSAAVALDGVVDAILLTGGMAHSKYLVDYITNKVKFISPVYPYPGEDELLALSAAVHRVLRGEEEAKLY